jgi:hypothetical protein
MATYSARDVADWPMPHDLADVEHALERGRLYVEMTSGRFWQARRNGRTQTWARDKYRFRVPVKAGLKAYGEATRANRCNFRIQPPPQEL